MIDDVRSDITRFEPFYTAAARVVALVTVLVSLLVAATAGEAATGVLVRMRRIVHVSRLVASSAIAEG